LKRRVRSGFTTGACATAAAKAAATILFTKNGVAEVEIPFPDGRRVVFAINGGEYSRDHSTGRASVVKDAGDDPDVTDGVEIEAEARFASEADESAGSNSVVIKGGPGVGRVTKPGLALPVGEAAINPIPRKMIESAVKEAILQYGGQDPVEITVSVPAGEELAKKTLNARLGIIGGISILGTTGIVRPISSEAWTATITATLDVARAMGQKVAVLSAGRASEKAHMAKFDFPEESYVMMGDYLEFALNEAGKKAFASVHVCAQWAKMVKIAMATPQTHVRHGAIDMKRTVDFLKELGINLPADRQFNTAREIFLLINATFTEPRRAFSRVCAAADRYIATMAPHVPLFVHLASYEGEIIASNR
jgi:cobalt-precorrin-5B (C1)-methyltransferase